MQHEALADDAEVEVLLLEDNPGDSRLFQELLAESTLHRFRVEPQFCLRGALVEIQKREFDLLVIDLSLPDSEGLETYRSVQQLAEDTPVIVLTGRNDLPTAIETLRSGAQDYLLKNDLNPALLERSLCYALERKKLTLLREGMRQARTELETIRETSSRFLSNLSHELRTPLTATAGYLQLLANSELKPDQQDLAGKARDGCGQLNTMINGLLELCKIEQHKITANCHWVDPAEWLTRLEATYRKEAKRRSLSLHWQCDLPAKIFTDIEKLEFVIDALMNNALKFTRHGEISLVALSSCDNMTVTVADTGPGLADDSTALFDTFNHDISYLSTEGKGAGLGLPITRAYCSAMDGSITATNREPVGAVFEVILPISTRQATRQSEPPLAHEIQAMTDEQKRVLKDALLLADQEKLRNLLVECNLKPGVVDQLAEMIRTYRYEELLDLLEEEEP